MTAMPMLASTFSATPSITTGGSRLVLHGGGRLTRSGGAVADLRDRIANSSAPRRASMCVLGKRHAQPPRDLAQHTIAVGVAERVVDLGEAVEIDQQHRDLCGRVELEAHHLRDALDEQRAVWAAP